MPRVKHIRFLFTIAIYNRKSSSEKGGLSDKQDKKETSRKVSEPGRPLGEGGRDDRGKGRKLIGVETSEVGNVSSIRIYS